MPGKIQNEDLKSLAELTAAGGSASQLPNDTKIYVTANGLNKQLSQAITDGDIGGGGQGGINYIENYDFKTDVSGWSITKNTSAAAIPDSGFVSSGTSNTIARSTSAPLRDIASGLYTLAALGNQLIYDFEIDAADKGKVLQGSFEYAIASGTCADDTVTVWIYDVTNARFIQPAPYLLKNHSLPAEKFPFEFQTAIDSVSYRLVIHQAAASTAALKFDNVSVGPQAKLYGSALTDWQDAGSITTTNISSTIARKKVRQVGDTAEYDLAFTTTSSGSGVIYINLDKTIDTAKFQAGALVGIARGTDAGISNYVGVVSIAGPNSVFINAHSSTDWASTIPFSWNTGDFLEVNFKVPIQGWSSSQIMSHDANTRVVAARATKATGTHTSSGSYQAVSSWSTAEIDTVGGFNSTTGVYTVKVPGVYLIHGVVGFSANATGSRYIAVRKNGSGAQILSNSASNMTTDVFLSFSGTLNLISGDTIELVGFQNSGGNLNYVPDAGINNFNISMLQGPAQIMASSTVAADYKTSAGQTIPHATDTIVNFGTKVFDDTNSVTTGASWKFTAPISGKYLVSTTVSSNSSWQHGDYLDLIIYKNTALYCFLDIDRFQATITNYFSWGGSRVVQLLQGEYIDIRVQTGRAAANSINLHADANINYVSITRVGNY